ncbi:DUF4166 domain-containing protein [Microbacterium sp. HD4P20]|uniref:DUF4166 domain-containing protein n=1 Tax=Microbacterium sp. HD4P20 TaxID=2864874 RepID=UPI001C63F1C7|nr:DUF4166 domain-containing protein [Microbacterium sp. HD4P20]MCP2635027.1 DUF4166 domain-containing protein [Microbacterium sp. HD4P20]
MTRIGTGAGGARQPDPGEASVYQRVLGDEFALLQPRLQTYFGPIPRGSVGVGSGIYEMAGSPARWLSPVLAIMASRHILFPEFERDVPFAITNTPGRDGSLSATRTFRFARRHRLMEDTMSVIDGRLVDRLGKRRGLEVALDLWVEDGALRMASTRLALRVAGIRLPLPRLATVHLDESVDSADLTLQHVDVRITAPLVGEIFRYAGDFTYELRPASDKVSPPVDTGSR